jgi:hypothetical protein
MDLKPHPENPKLAVATVRDEHEENLVAELLPMISAASWRLAREGACPDKKYPRPLALTRRDLGHIAHIG